MKGINVVMVLTVVMTLSCRKDNAVCIQPLSSSDPSLTKEWTFDSWAVGRPDAKFKDFKNWCSFMSGEMVYN